MTNLYELRGNVSSNSSKSSLTGVINMVDFNKLQNSLGYKFQDMSLLKLALTHRSFSRQNNERLEFVGDGILDYVIAMRLYILYPHLSEGELSKIRASLVNQDTLVEIAIRLELGQYLFLGDGENRSGGRSRPSIIADCLEALFAAIRIDSSCTESARVIEWLYADYLSNAEHLISKDFKSLLQEHLQGRKISLPTYDLLATDGPDHDSIFHVECIIPALDIRALAQGKSKKEASQLAAKKALEEINSLADSR